MPFTSPIQQGALYCRVLLARQGDANPGTPLIAALDTGSTRTVVSVRAATLIQSHPLNGLEIHATGAVGQLLQAKQHAVRVCMPIGVDGQCKPFEVIAAAIVMQHAVDVIVGMDILGQGRLSIDGPGQEYTLDFP